MNRGRKLAAVYILAAAVLAAGAGVWQSARDGGVYARHCAVFNRDRQAFYYVDGREGTEIDLPFAAGLDKLGPVAGADLMEGGRCRASGLPVIEVKGDGLTLRLDQPVTFDTVRLRTGAGTWIDAYAGQYQLSLVPAQTENAGIWIDQMDVSYTSGACRVELKGARGQADEDPGYLLAYPIGAAPYLACDDLVWQGGSAVLNIRFQPAKDCRQLDFDLRVMGVRDGSRTELLQTPVSFRDPPEGEPYHMSVISCGRAGR